LYHIAKKVIWIPHGGLDHFLFFCVNLPWDELSKETATIILNLRDIFDWSTSISLLECFWNSSAGDR